MKHLNAQRKNKADFSRRFVDEHNYDTLLTESTTVMFEGKPLLVFLKNVIPLDVNRAAIAAAKTMPLATNNRGTAGGIQAVRKIKEDGTQSNTLRVQVGWEVNSGIIGFFEREARRPYCHATAWTDKYRGEFNTRIVPLAELVAQLYSEYCSEAFSYYQSFANKTPKDWLIGKSPFTTITVNKNFRTACHKDAGDLPGGRSCMTVMSEGNYKGAHLVLPSFGLGVDIRMGDLIIFDPHEFHGNTQIVKLSPKAARYSMVFYYRELMQFCKSPAAELEYAKNRKPGDKLFPEAE